MRKLHLELDDLSVESFETTESVSGFGTVAGHASFRCNTNLTCDPLADSCGEGVTCADYATCYVSCHTNCPLDPCGGGGGGGSWAASNCAECETNPPTFGVC